MLHVHGCLVFFPPPNVGANETTSDNYISMGDAALNSAILSSSKVMTDFVDARDAFTPAIHPSAYVLQRFGVVLRAL